MIAAEPFGKEHTLKTATDKETAIEMKRRKKLTNAPIPQSSVGYDNSLNHVDGVWGEISLNKKDEEAVVRVTISQKDAERLEKEKKQAGESAEGQNALAHARRARQMQSNRVLSKAKTLLTFKPLLALPEPAHCDPSQMPW